MSKMEIIFRFVDQMLYQGGAEPSYILTDAGLAQELEQLELTERSQAKHRVIKRCYLFDCDLSSTRSMDS